jgi:hypothetical protein
MQLSSAITEILQHIPEPSLLERVSFTFQNASATAASLRGLDFKKFEERDYERNSTELWNELEPMITHVLGQMDQFLALLKELFPARADDGAAEDTNFDDLLHD